MLYQESNPTIDRQVMNMLAQVNTSCLHFAYLMAKSLNKVSNETANKNQGLADALNQVSYARCMHYTAYALKLLIENNVYENLQSVIPLCTHICEDENSWEYHFLLIIKLPSGCWTYLSPGNYSPANINNKLAFNWSTFNNLQDLLINLEKKFKVRYPVDVSSVESITKDFSLMISNTPITITTDYLAQVSTINFPYINYGRIGIQLQVANIHLPIINA